jgi:glycosyltransferase involved in cell wall biosynthesis
MATGHLGELGMRQLKVLLSAYACEPALGSEPGIGWNIAKEVAQHHEVWVLTRSNNRPVIETELARNPVPNLHFVYHDLPHWARWWKRKHRGLHVYYYLWQLGAYYAARQLHRKVGIDLAHHVTFGTYWKPSLLSLLPTPFIWGPVGGGESMPETFRSALGFRGKVFEATRNLARRLGEHDPLVRITARRSTLALATTGETAERLRRLGTTDIRVFTAVGLDAQDIGLLRLLKTYEGSAIRFISIGRLLHWKGFHLGLRAFAQAGPSDAEYWIVGDGPEGERLQALAKELGIARQVKFWGGMPREETLRRLSDCHVLVHPSLHDSGGWVCLEAMAAGRPVICLDLGGPAMQVTKETGFRVPAIEPRQSVSSLAEAMRMLAKDPERRVRMGEAARRRAVEHFDWSKKGARIAELHRKHSK